ncbi:MAG: hypothetical protein HND43_02775 [Armatimonadetes bacterium]|nr:hypothetical protein [Armatimonadota bacterium]GIK32523.1 MAG: hypothetical protein BroJett009_15150 [Armatimonadota bacterium]
MKLATLINNAKCTSCMKKISMMLAAMSVLGLIVAALYQSNLESKAALTQRIKPYDSATAELLGEVGTPIGDPQLMIITDPKAFLSGKGEQGQRFVNDEYLKSNGIYPLQVKTVAFVGGIVKLGLLGMAAVMSLAAWFFGRRAKSCGASCAPRPKEVGAQHC